MSQERQAPPFAPRRFEYKVINTGKDVEEQLNRLGAKGWQVVGVTTKSSCSSRRRRRAKRPERLTTVERGLSSQQAARPAESMPAGLG